MIWVFLPLFALHLFLSLSSIQDGGLPLFLRMFFAPEIWLLYGVIMLFFRFVVLKGLYDGGVNIGEKKINEIHNSISDRALESLQPKGGMEEKYLDLNVIRVCPGAIRVDFENKVFQFYRESWESYTQTPPRPFHFSISFSEIIGFEIKRRGETVFSSDTTSSALVGYAIGGVWGAAMLSSSAKNDEVQKHERRKRMDVDLNLITSSKQTPLVSLPITRKGFFSSASNEVIDKSIEEILAIFKQISISIAEEKIPEPPQTPLIEEVAKTDEQTTQRRRRRASSPSQSKVSELVSLNNLLQSGAITEEEFRELKKEIMESQ